MLCAPAGDAHTLISRPVNRSAAFRLAIPAESTLSGPVATRVLGRNRLRAVLRRLGPPPFLDHNGAVALRDERDRAPPDALRSSVGGAQPQVAQDRGDHDLHLIGRE